MTFRKQAISTLKSLRSAGYPLQVKLNSSNVSLKAELERLESVLKEECHKADKALAEQSKTQKKAEWALALKEITDWGYRELEEVAASRPQDTAWVNSPRCDLPQHPEADLKEERRKAEEAIDAALESEQYGVEDAFIAEHSKEDDEPSLTSDAIKVAAIATARLVHAVKAIDYRKLAAKALLVILYATLYTIKAVKATIKVGRVTAKATSKQRRFLKDMTKAGWNFVKLHPTVTGTHRSELLETIFCLG